MLKKLKAALVRFLVLAFFVLAAGAAMASWLVDPNNPLDGFHVIVGIVKAWVAAHPSK